MTASPSNNTDFTRNFFAAPTAGIPGTRPRLRLRLIHTIHEQSRPLGKTNTRRLAASARPARSRIAPPHGFFDKPTALVRIQGPVSLHLCCFACQILVLDDVAKPGGIIAGIQVMLPGFIVDAEGNIDELV